MQDGSVDTYLPGLGQRLFCGAEEPYAKFAPAISIFDLFVIFHVVADQQIRPFTFPEPPPNALFRAAS